jgi:hypothetical protein
MGKFIGKVTDAVGLTDIKGTQQRGEQSAAAQREAALRAAQISAFRPVGMTSRFGSGQFDITDVGGVPRVTGASYTVSPELKAIQDQLMGLTGGAVTTAEEAQMAAQPLGMAAQRLFNLGGQYISESPEAARQRIFDQLQQARMPTQLQEEQRLASGAFGRGRVGLNIGGMGQPELYSLARAREAQRAQDIVSAEQQAQQQVQFGSGLYGLGSQRLGEQYAIPTQALGPLQSYLGTIGSIEEMGQQPFKLGLAVGGAAQPGATAGAQMLQTGLSSAAATQQRAGDAASGQLTGFMNQMLGAAMGAAGGGFGGGSSLGNLFGNPMTAMRYGTNLGSQQTRMLAAQDAWF